MSKQRDQATFFRVNKILTGLFFSSFFVLNFIFSGFVFDSQHFVAFAATQAATESAHVTLKVVDTSNPTTPILISPTNNSYVTIGTPTFVWEQSSDDRGISKYQFFLNGSLVYDNLPTGDQETSNYIYEHNVIDGEYSLELKNLISDGTYTWKVKVYDINGNFSESATWTFIVDTLAPTFVISSIGDVATSISAQDLGTIPASPLELAENEPLITATGEPNSTVVVTVTAPGDPVQTFTTTIDALGNWSLQLGVFTRGDIINLDFTITDPAGLVSVINGVQFLIEEIIIVFPPVSPTPSPSASPSPLVSPTPGVSPEPSPSPEISPTPSPSPTIPTIEIPYIPPREAVLELIQEIGERLPEPIKVLISMIPEGVVKTVQELAPISAAVVASALPVASTIAIGAQFGGNLSFEIFLRLLQSLGLLPAGKPQGLVFNSETFEPVPFALITIYSENSQVQITETVVTDSNGVYKGVKLAPGMYRIVVSHQDFLFPSAKKRPAYTQFKDFYLGEVFNVTSEKQQQLFLIPIDPKEKSNKKSFKTRFRIFLARLGRFTQHLSVPLFFITGLLFLVFPTLWNGLVFFFYFLMVLQKFAMTLKRPIITGIVVDKTKTPLENAIIRIIEPNNNELISVITTNKSGQFKIYADKGLYRVEVVMAGYVWQEVATSMSFYQVDATRKTQDLLIVMESVEDLYQELFS